LKNSGGTIELYKPDPPQSPAHPDWRYVPYILVDRVNFNDKVPWPTGADGGGYSLQRIVADATETNRPTGLLLQPHLDGRTFKSIHRNWWVALRSRVFRTAGSSYSIQSKPDLTVPGGLDPVDEFQSLADQRLASGDYTSHPFKSLYRLVSPAQ